ncbi:hypothetical protein MKW98_002256 [Papaver atlanticum]|uniref:Uncharacterized protein n=1 Tax=Papaver atlanticum TaxID=357466 RepID=A0AAD4X2U5_9MAGN|nr:hypothetical protein MKW98_002256 [Papaver atlanticum]
MDVDYNDDDNYYRTTTPFLSYWGLDDTKDKEEIHTPVEIDAIDDTDLPPRYVNNTGLSARIGRINPDWFDPDQSAE